MKKIFFSYLSKKNLAFILATSLSLISFQNCSKGSFSTPYSDLSRTPTSLSNTSSTTFQPNSNLVLLGQALYDNNCSSCHNQYVTSNLKGRIVSADKIISATNNISAMAPLKGGLSNEQLSSLESLFLTSSNTTNSSTSSFSCPNTDAEKYTSFDLVRLSTTELQNTYKFHLGSAIWNTLSDSYYLLPLDTLTETIGNKLASFSSSDYDKISRLNEAIAIKITSSNTNITSFFGSCASSSSFSKTCFDSFMNSKASRIFRSSLNTDDLTTTWSQVSSTNDITEQLKILVQILFNDPRFLYHIETGSNLANTNSGTINLTSYEIANRIAYGMTAAPPDDILWTEATKNTLTSLTNVSIQVDRISSSIEFQNRVVSLVKFYMGQTLGSPSTNATFLAGINTTNLAPAIETEFDDFVKYVIFTQKGSIYDLFTSKISFPKNQSLATILGTSVWTNGAPLTTPNHAGLLTRPFFTMTSSPKMRSVPRGHKIRSNILCSDVPQPSAADLAARVDLTEAQIKTLTSRQATDLATLSAASCVTCHSKMNEIGYTLGQYDSLGRFITQEGIYNDSGLKLATFNINSTTIPKITETDSQQFSNAITFQEALAKSDALHQCFTMKTYEYFSKQSANLSLDSCRLNKMDTLLKSGNSVLNFFLQNFKHQSILYKKGSL